jgi:hypothetical protein
MKLGAKELVRLIRETVRDEMESLVPKMIEKHLAEAYVRRIVREERKPANETMMLKPIDDEDHIPSPKENDNRGIYQDKENEEGLDTDVKKEGLAYLLSKENPLVMFYEGTSPDEYVRPTAPLKNTNIDVMQRIMEGMEKRGPVTVPKDERSYESKMRELEMRRKALDVPAK